MTALYVVATLVVSLSCPNLLNVSPLGPTFSPTNGGINAVTQTNIETVTADIKLDGHGCFCPSNLDVSFTLSKDNADNALVRGAQVWKIETFPLKVSKLDREAVTTYSVKTNVVEVR